MTVDQNISSRINLMRIVLISGIVFVHVPHNPATSPFLGANGLFDWLRVFIGDSLFRIGVPCLSVISGYLLFQRGRQAFDYGKVLRSKAKTVLLPFLLWNGVLLAAVLAMQHVGIGDGYFPDLWSASPREFASHAVAAEGFPINLPLYFLRDLVVCILLSPILAFLVRRYAAITLSVLFLLAILPDVTMGIVLKKSILFSFTFGIFLALRQFDPKALDGYALVGSIAVLAAAMLLAIGQYHTGPDFPFWLELGRNTLAIVGAIGFWLMSSFLIRSSVGKKLAGTGSLSFWMFCGHYPLLVLLWMVWNRVGSEDAYPYFYVGAISVVFLVLIVSNRLVLRMAPSLYQVLTGSRGRKRLPPGSDEERTPVGPSVAGEAIVQQQR